MEPGADPAAVQAAAEAVSTADRLLFTSGAGMGVDSGLPDFRGNDGFWNAYPPYRHLGLSFSQMANPEWFVRDPAFAWGFYGHRLELYRKTAPHEGFAILRRWAAKKDAFVFTSNVDGHFQRAGFDESRVVECHGAIEWMQCTRDCGAGIFPATGVSVDVDAATFRANGALPACPGCGALARPNILMFGDGGWDPERTSAQESRLESWLAANRDERIVVVECGAGTAIPTVRRFGEHLARMRGALVRINVREHDVPAGQIAIAAGACAALRAIDRHVELA